MKDKDPFLKEAVAVPLFWIGWALMSIGFMSIFFRDQAGVSLKPSFDTIYVGSGAMILGIAIYLGVSVSNYLQLRSSRKTHSG